MAATKASCSFRPTAPHSLTPIIVVATDREWVFAVLPDWACMAMGEGWKGEAATGMAKRGDGQQPETGRQRATGALTYLD